MKNNISNAILAKTMIDSRTSQLYAVVKPTLSPAFLRAKKELRVRMHRSQEEREKRELERELGLE